MHIIQRLVSTLCHVKIIVSTVKYHNKGQPLSSLLLSSTMSPTLQFSNKYLVDLLEHLIVIRSDFSSLEILHIHLTSF